MISKNTSKSNWQSACLALKKRINFMNFYEFFHVISELTLLLLLFLFFFCFVFFTLKIRLTDRHVHKENKPQGKN